MRQTPLFLVLVFSCLVVKVLVGHGEPGEVFSCLVVKVLVGHGEPGKVFSCLVV